MRANARILGLLVGIGLVVIGLRIDWKRLPIDELRQTLNDQVGYISVARQWVDAGRLDSRIIYPSLLRQRVARNSLYMPGFYAELALVYRWLGYSTYTSRLPSLLGFLVASGLMYGITRRLYGPEAALFAAALFAFFPLNLVYAFTAMSEIPLLAAALVAFAVFVRARGAARWWVGPLALTLPILFRETGVVLGLVMSAMLYFGGGERRILRALACSGLAFAVLVAVLISPAGAGRPSMWKGNILAQGDFDAIYTDAFAADRLPASAKDWVLAVAHKFLSNAHSLVSPQNFALQWFERVAMLFVLSGMPLGLWLWWRKRDGFALGVAVATSVLLAADLCVYTVWMYRGIRSMLLMQPLVAVLWGVVIGGLTWNTREFRQRLVVAALFLAGVSTAWYVLWTQAPVLAWTQGNTEFLESVVRDDRRMVVSPVWISLDYVNEHYPQLWAFDPVNCETLQLLAARYEIGTLVRLAEPGLPPQRLCGTGLAFEGERQLRSNRFWVYRNEAGGQPSHEF